MLLVGQEGYADCRKSYPTGPKNRFRGTRNSEKLTGQT